MLDTEFKLCYSNSVMKKYVPLLLICVSLAGLAVLGVGSALGSKPSDVSIPVSTPDASLVRYHVVGTSMSPTINDGDWLLADTKVRSFQPGIIIILRYPKDQSTLYCRRIIAVAGDKVVMKYYSNVKITTVYDSSHPGGTVFPQGIIPNGNAYGEYDSTVTPGNVYVVGDDTAPGGSFDSDEWGLLPVGDIVGVVIRRTSPAPHVF
jgi:signal peptidase I